MSNQYRHDSSPHRMQWICVAVILSTGMVLCGHQVAVSDEKVQPPVIAEDRQRAQDALQQPSTTYAPQFSTAKPVAFSAWQQLGATQALNKTPLLGATPLLTKAPLLSAAQPLRGTPAARSGQRPGGAQRTGESQPVRRRASNLMRVWTFADYNTRVVVGGTTLLGLAAGLVGSFTLLRRRALMGDALSHATLPGIGIAYMIMVASGGSGKSLAGLLCGAAVSGMLGMGTILLIRNLSRVKEDAALGIVLSSFFGAGVALLGVIQQMPGGSAAGLESFIYGKTASMIATDAQLIAATSLVCVLISILLFKELRLLCFDESFGASLGYPVILLDVLLTGLVILVTIVGLQAVGLVLMIALLVIPAAAARFWTHRMSAMTWWGAGLGALSGAVGSTTSAILPQLPSGATIVMVSSTLFALSLLVGAERGLIVRLHRRWKLMAHIDRQHFLRSIYELLETRGQLGRSTGDRSAASVSWQDLYHHRSWLPRRLKQQIRAATNRDEVTIDEVGNIRLTAAGQREAARLVHEHRLWELYLITHADVAPSQVDQGADTIEHVLDAAMIAELEGLLEQGPSAAPMVRSPHPLDPSSSKENLGG